MGNVRRGTMTAPNQWWKHLDWCKRVFWKRERQAQKRAIPARLEDDYTYDEFMADVCEPCNPCEQCINSHRVCCDD